MDNVSMKLYARLRGNRSPGAIRTSQNLKQLTLHDSTGKEQRSYDFHQIFVTGTSQQELFIRSVKPLLDHIKEGHDACFLTYGPANSGKSYTILGEDSPSHRGIFPRSVDFFLEESETATISLKVSFLELYGNTLRDLGLAYTDPRAADIFLCQNLETGESGGRFTVIGATEIEIHSVQQAQELVSKGMALRATHEARSGAYSSKAHTIIVIHLVQSPDTVSSLYLVDLAGSDHSTQDFDALAKFCSSLNSTMSTHSDRKLIQLLEPAKNTISLLINVNLSIELQQETLVNLSFAENCCNSVPEDIQKIKLLQDERADLKKRLRNAQELQEEQLKTITRMLGLETDPELLITAAPGSKSLQELHLQKEAVLNIDVIAKKNRDLEKKIEETRLVFDKIKKSEYTNQETHIRKVLELRDELGRLRERVQESKAHAKYTQNECAEAKTAELHKMLRHTQHLLNEKSAIIKKLPESMRIQDAAPSDIDTKELAREHIKNEFNKRFREQEINHSKQFEEIHNKYKQILQGKEKTLKSMVGKFKTMTIAKKQGISALCAEMLGIFRIAHQQKRVLENIKQGKYTQNHRPLHVPQGLVPEFPDSSSFPRLFSTLGALKPSSHPAAKQLKAARVPMQRKTEICHPAITKDIPSLSQDEANATLCTLRGVYKALNKEYEEFRNHHRTLYEQKQALEAEINCVTEERDRYRELYMKEASNKRVVKECK